MLVMLIIIMIVMFTIIMLVTFAIIMLVMLIIIISTMFRIVVLNFHHLLYSTKGGKTPKKNRPIVQNLPVFQKFTAFF